MKRLLLDTHIVVSILRQDLAARFPCVRVFLEDADVAAFISVASLWEIAIKARLGKLDPGMPLEDMARALEEMGIAFLPIDISHVIKAADPEPATRDPFDRLLLAQCQVEVLQLVTVDRALFDHRLTLKF